MATNSLGAPDIELMTELLIAMPGRSVERAYRFLCAPGIARMQRAHRPLGAHLIKH